MKTLSIIFVLLAVSTALADTIIGGDVSYTIQKGDTLELVGARLMVGWPSLKNATTLDKRDRLIPGQIINASNRHIVPQTSIANGIVVNLPDRTLYYFRDGLLQTAFGVSLGTPQKKSGLYWRTPLGKFKTTAKAKKPSWYIPKSILYEMELAGKPAVSNIVAPGKDNPLGRYAVKLSIPGILIHETIWPSSIYQYRSHGCIRVMPERMEPFFDMVKVGDEGEIIYEPVKVASIDGTVWLEVHPDVYGKVKDLQARTDALLNIRGLKEKTDPEKVKSVVKRRRGIAEDVTKR